MPQRLQRPRALREGQVRVHSRVGWLGLLETAVPSRLLWPRRVPQRHLLVQAWIWRHRLRAADVPWRLQRQRMVPGRPVPLLSRVWRHRLRRARGGARAAADEVRARLRAHVLGQVRALALAERRRHGELLCRLHAAAAEAAAKSGRHMPLPKPAAVHAAHTAVPVEALTSELDTSGL